MSTDVASSLGLKIDTVGALASNVKKSYVLMPVKLLPAVSVTDPDGKTTKYWVLAGRSTVGSIVNEVPDRESLVLVAALKDSMMAPLAEPLRITMLPVPLAMFSEKVSVILLPTATAVASSVGLKVVTLGAIVSGVLKFSVLVSLMPT